LRISTFHDFDHLGNDTYTLHILQLPSVHRNPSCGECGRDAEERKDSAKRVFGQQNVAKERL